MHLYAFSYLVSAQNDDYVAKDVAAHILAQLLTAQKELKGIDEEMKSFLSFLLHAPGRQISSLGFSGALVYMLKVYENMQFFINSDGLYLIRSLLKKERDDKQICYNLLTCLWIISFKPHTLRYFEDKQNEFFESIIKILQLHGNEKIVRIILYIFKVKTH